MVNKKLQVALPLLFAIVMVLGMVVGYELRKQTGGDTRQSSLQEVLNLVKTKYVDDVKIDSINQATITELLSHLDPHSIYIPPKKLTEVNEQLEGNFEGIGVEFQMIHDSMNIITVIKDGPSEKAGLKVGDIILKANDSVVLSGKKIEGDEIRKNLRGPSGSAIKLYVLRNNKTQNITVNRGIILLPTIEAAYMIAPQTGYIKINRFGERTYVEFMQNLERLQKQKMEKLIVDVRGNPGGYMSAATDIADEFLDGDKLIVYTKGKNDDRIEYRCKRDGLFEKGKLVVLIDETSASASEVLAGALQDWDRAAIVGRRSFGKGLVQQQYNLSDGGALRLTVARYYTPVGRNIQKPYDKGKVKYEEELYERYHDGEVMIGDTSKPKGQSYKTPSGHIVYGGGGITPDVFVALDTSLISKNSAKMYTMGGLYNFVFKYYFQNQSYFQSYKDVNNFIANYHVSDKELSALNNFPTSDSLQFIKPASLKDKEILFIEIKQLIGRQLFGKQGYLEVANVTDNVVQKSLLIIK
jgi:carboxyl-terminal processing protease